MAENDTLTVYGSEPYYDDLLTADGDGLTPLDKNYMRVLFKPGRSVQSRELNQIQSLLQAQLDRFGKSLFQSNKPIFGGEINFDRDVLYIDVDVPVAKVANLESWLAGDLTQLELRDIAAPGVTLTAIITRSEIPTGVAADDPSTDKRYRFFIKYKSNNTNSNNVNTDAFVTNITINKIDEPALGNITATIKESGQAVAAALNPGFYFIRGSAVQVSAQYTAQTLDADEDLYTGYVGLIIDETLVTSEDDITLLDNTNGINKAFIGADRYKINLTLGIKKTLSEKFVQLLDISDSQVIREVDSGDNSSVLERLFARRTYEESGDYTLGKVKTRVQEIYNNGSNGGRYDSIQDIQDVGSLFGIRFTGSDENVILESANYFAFTIQPIVGYVKGYRSRLPEPFTIIVPKANQTYRDLNNNENYKANITADVGNYVTATVSDGVPNIDAFSTVYTLYDNSPSELGECKIRTVEGLGGNTVRLYLHNIILNPGKVFSETYSIKSKSIISGDYGQPVFTLTEPGILNESNRASSLYRWPENVIDNVTNLRISEKRSFSELVSIGSNRIIYSLTGIDEIFDKSTTNILASYYDSSEGEYITFNDFDIVPGETSDILTLDVTASLSNGQLEAAGVTPPSTGDASDKVRIICSVTADLADSTVGIKKLTSVTNLDVNTIDSEITAGDIITLPNVYHLISIEPNDDGALEWEIVSDGQRDTEYINATVKALKDDPETISYTHWAFEGTGKNYYTRNSYIDGNDVKVQLSQISRYNGVPLSEYLDLRLKTGSNDRVALDPGSPIEAEINFYLSRKDLLIANTQNYFNVLSGVSSSRPNYPKLSDDSIALSQLVIPAVSKIELNSIEIRNIENRRYTMRDIGSLETRIKNLEYYTSLSLLEKSAADQSIYSETGLERFKNGFIVDGFRGHDIANPSANNYLCSIDRPLGRLYPHFDPSNVSFVVSSGDDTSSIEPNDQYSESGLTQKVLTCRYNSVEFISQPYASQTLSVQPHDIVGSRGNMLLIPEEDSFVDNLNPDKTTTINPFGAVNAAIRELAEAFIVGSEHGEVQVLSETTTNRGRRGDPGSGTATAEQAIASAEAGGNPRGWRVTTLTQETLRNILTLSDEEGADNLNQSLGKYVEDVNLQLYMRSRPVQFEVTGLSPNTRYYAFFDNINVTAYCLPRIYDDETLPSESFDDSEFLGNTEESLLEVFQPPGDLISDADGKVYGIFIIPNSTTGGLRFATGEKIFKLTNSVRNNSEEETSFAAARFVAGGLTLTTDERIISSRVPELAFESVQETVVTSTARRWRDDPVAQSFKIDEIIAPAGACVTDVSVYFGAKPSTGSDTVMVYLVTMANGYPTQSIIAGSMVEINADQVNISDDGSAETNFKFEHPIYLLPGEEYALVVFSKSNQYFVYISDLGDSDIASQQIIASQPALGVFFTSANKSTWSASQNRDLKFTLNRAKFETNSNSTVIARARIPGNIGSVNVINGGTNYALNDATLVFPAPDDGIAASGTPIIDVNNGSIVGVDITNPGIKYTSPVTIDVNSNNGSDASLEGNLVRVDISSFMLLQRAINISTFTSVSNSILLGTKSYNGVQSNNFITDLKAKDHYINAANQNDNALIMSLNTTNEYVAPFIDRETLSLYTRKYRISMVEPVDSRIEGDTSLYISRRIGLGNPADQIDGWISINRPTSLADVKIYIQPYDSAGEIILTNDNLGEEWWEISPTSPRVIPTNSDRNKYAEVRYTRNFEDELEFSSFVIKIVLLSSNIVDIPSCKDLRFIATS